MGGMGQDNADVNRDANDVNDVNDGSGASDPHGTPRDGGTLNMAPEDEAPQRQDAPWYAAAAEPHDAPPAAAAADPTPSEALPPMPPMPPMPPVPPLPPDAEPADVEPRDAEPRDAGAADAGPQDVEPRDVAPQDTGPRDVEPRDVEPQDEGASRDAEPEGVEPQEASPQDIEPRDVEPQDASPQDALPPRDASSSGDEEEAGPEPVPAGLPPEPGTVFLSTRAPRDAAPPAPAGTLDMGHQGPQDAGHTSGGGTVHLGATGPADAVPEVEEGPEPVRWEPLPAEAGTVPLASREPEDAPASHAVADDEDASLGGEAPLVGLPGRAGRDEDSEEASLGGAAPLVGLPTEPDLGPLEESSAPGADGGGEPGWLATDQAGRLLAGRYRLTDAVGRGGMGTVWRAHDEMLGRVVAVKELRLPGGVDDSERGRLITRTLREAKAIASIRSQGVVTVFDVVDEGSRPWIVMELIEGRSLADIIRSDGPMPPTRVAEIGLAVLDVLRAAHGAGILHRDVKPSNVLVAQEDGRVVLTDFGIAKVEGDPSITSTGMLVGAPSYISPERARGDLLGPPADLWSLGALLYCCVEGMPPYDEGSAIATLAAVMHDPVPPPHQAGVLTEVITGLLEKQPGDRLTEGRARELLLTALEPPPTPLLPPVPVPPGGAAGEEAAATPPPPGDSTMIIGTGHPAPGPPPSPSPAPSPYGPMAAPGTPPTPPPAVPLPAHGGGDAGGTGTPGGAGGSSRRRLLIIVGAVVVALALVGVVLAVALGGSDSDDNPGDGESGGQDSGEPGGESPTETTDPTQDPTGDPTEDPTDQPTEDPTEEPTDDGPPGTVPSNDPDATLPDNPGGMSQHAEEGLRFSLSLPASWERAGAGTYRAPGDDPAAVEVTFDSSPADSALSAWQAMEPAVSGDASDYTLVSASPVQWRDYPTVADWEFEQTEDGERVHVLNRLFRVDDDRGYTIAVSCAADAWQDAECESLRETVFDSFQPLD